MHSHKETLFVSWLKYSSLIFYNNIRYLLDMFLLLLSNPFNTMNGNKSISEREEINNTLKNSQIQCACRKVYSLLRSKRTEALNCNLSWTHAGSYLMVHAHLIKFGLNRYSTSTICILSCSTYMYPTIHVFLFLPNAWGNFLETNESVRIKLVFLYASRKRIFNFAFHMY